MSARTSRVAVTFFAANVFAAIFAGLPGLATAQFLVPGRGDIAPIHRPIVRPVRPIPRPVFSSYRIRSVDVQGAVHDQAAKIRMSQVFQNTSSSDVEAQVVFPIPEGAAISDLTLLYDGKELPGRLLPKEEARRIYEDIVRRQRDPALLEYLGAGIYQTRVFPIPPHADRIVEIRYTQLLKKSGGLVDLLLPLGTLKHANHAIDTLSVSLRLETTDALKSVYSPTHTVTIERPDEHHAIGKVTLNNVTLPDDLRVLYSTHAGAVGMNLISYRPNENEDGYFLLLASPDLKSRQAAAIPKTAVIVVDRSGSMAGQKIEQARQAVKFFLGQLNPADKFNVIAYDSDIEAFRPTLQPVTPETIKAAKGFADNNINAGGGTNIDEALKTALGMLSDDTRPSYVLFLTDGMPTVGERSERTIVSNARSADRVHARIFNLGIGFDVNGRLLDRLSRDFNGQSAYVRPNEDIETYVSALSTTIGSPLLTNLEVKFEFDKPAALAAPSISRTYPRNLTDLFAGEQLVWVGRYRESGSVKLTLSGDLAGKRQTYTVLANLAPHSIPDANAFVEKVWATRRIGELIDEIDLNGKNKELTDELVHLSLKHGIMTPYTSFLADERVDLADRRNLGIRTGESLDQLQATDGASGFEQREFKRKARAADQAPTQSSFGGGLGSMGRGLGGGGFDLGGFRDGGNGTGGGGGHFGGRGLEGMSGNGSAGGRGIGGRVGGIGGGGAGGFGGGGLSTGKDPLPADPAASGDSRPSHRRRPSASRKVSDVATRPVVQTVGDKTFYWKNNRWRDADLTEETEKNPTRVEQFSDAYFALASRDNGRFAKYLALDGPILVRLDEKTYLIEPPETN
ncbi:MAG TPA: VIT and VWA domain-containing protein [Planctomycetaceae bacterium]|jgi:Ca-activated chloride channel family protein|nr:VIT and VWA domain-containing protein [Planctomycetaceae bacterium]